VIVTSKNFVLKLEEILKDNLPTERYNEHENIVLGMIRDWHSEQKNFTHYTSGSTGRPKKVKISREKIELSAKSTLEYIDADNEIKTSLLCLDPRHIGGAMVVYRALVYGHDLAIIEPTSSLKQALNDDQNYDLASMVPMQFKGLGMDELSKVKHILIGGAPIAVDKREYKPNVFATFGMTETVSHIALRRISEESFTTTGDTQVAVSTNGTLKIHGSITDNKWLETNDVVEVYSSTSFKWLGRADFMINSGGIKINPEYVEAQLMDQIAGEFMAGSIPDDKFGRKLILLIAGDRQSLDFSSLEKYHRPKEVFFNQKIIKTPGNKIDRLKTQELFETSL